MLTITLDGRSLTRGALAAIADRSARIALDPAALEQVSACARFLDDAVARGEPIYGVTTGFGSNADRLLGAHRARDELRASHVAGVTSGEPLPFELQRNLVVSHAVSVGAPLAPTVVRAMLAIRINTLLRGHSGIRASTLEALARLLECDVIPVIPELGSVGASGDLSPLSHLAQVLLGHGVADVGGERLDGASALARAGLQPIALRYKEGLALNNGTAQMLASLALGCARLERLLAHADLAAAMSLDAFAGRSSAFRADVHALRPHPGQIESAANLRRLLAGSTLIDLEYHLAPRFRTWTAKAWAHPDDQAERFDFSWDWVAPDQRHGREAFYTRYLPFRGGKKHQPQDAYSLRCIPQVHGAVRDALAHAARIVDIELNAVTDNPLIFPDQADPRQIEDQVVSAGHFHGMPLALALGALKGAIPVLASIAERRIAKLVDAATNDGLPPFLVGNEDATDSGLMIVQYTAAAIVNDLATRAHPASVYSIPTSANAEDHVSMGTNDARHVLAMLDDLERVLALEFLVAAQALDWRRDMLNRARAIAARGEIALLAHKVDGRPAESDPNAAAFADEVKALAARLASAEDFHPGSAVTAAHSTIRRRIPFMPADRPLDRDITAIVELVASGELLAVNDGGRIRVGID